MVKLQLENWLALGFITYQRGKDELKIEMSKCSDDSALYFSSTQYMKYFHSHYLNPAHM